MTNRQKNIVTLSFVIAFISITIHVIQRHDEALLNNPARWERMSDTLANNATDEEKRVALQFSDTTLPKLKQLGLIKRYTRTEIETIITVSGALWKNRSEFFKKSFLEQIFTFNKVNGFAVNTKIIDDATAELYAEITPPDGRIIY